VKSDANDQNRVKLINGAMFVALNNNNQIADRSVKTLPKKIKNISLEASKKTS